MTMASWDDIGGVVRYNERYMPLERNATPTNGFPCFSEWRGYDDAPMHALMSALGVVTLIVFSRSNLLADEKRAGAATEEAAVDGAADAQDRFGAG